MAVETTTAAPAPSVLKGLEGAAWRIPLSTRRLFLAIAAGVVGAILASSLAAAWVASRNADTIADARSTGLDVARAATEFRTHLAAADAQAASTLLSGGLEAPDTRDVYVDNLAAASQALTDAALVATEDDREDIELLAAGLTRYAGLVETARANARQGFPVGAAYLGQARSLARDDLVPRADHLRRVGEQRVARAANSIGGPIGAAAIILLLLALAVLLASAGLIAGRSRRLTHPALLAAMFAAFLALLAVTRGIVAQSNELRAAATTDIDAYVAANDAAFTLSNLRVTEISAVAAHGSGGPLYDEFMSSATDLVSGLGRESRGAVEDYVAAVDQVRAADVDDGDNRAAAQLTLGDFEDQSRRDSSSGGLFLQADARTADDVDSTFADLSDRYDEAAASGIEPWVPVVLGFLAAGLAAAGTLARARRYR